MFPVPPRPVVKKSCLMVGVTRSAAVVALPLVWMFPLKGKICQSLHGHTDKEERTAGEMRIGMGIGGLTSAPPAVRHGATR